MNLSFKRWRIWSGVVMSCIVVNASLSEEKMADLQARLSKLTRIEGSAVGYTGWPGDFYLLYPKIVQTGTESDFNAMLANSRPIVSSMGAICILDRFPARRAEILRLMAEDKREVSVFPFGCVGKVMTVAALFEEIGRNANYVTQRQYPEK